MNLPTRTNGLELADVFRENSTAYQNAYKLPLELYSNVVD